MDSFTLAVVIGMVAVMVMLGFFVLVDKGAPESVATGKQRKRSS